MCCGSKFHILNSLEDKHEHLSYFEAHKVGPKADSVQAPAVLGAACLNPARQNPHTDRETPSQEHGRERERKKKLG